MAKVKGTSTAAMVLGVVGGVLDLPFALCSGVCAGAAMGMGDETELVEFATNFYLGLGVVAGIIAIIFGCMAKKAPKLAGGMLIFSTLLSLVCFGFTWNFAGLIATALTLIGAILCFTQKKVPVEEKQ